MNYKQRNEQQWDYVIARAKAHMTISDVANACGVSDKLIYKFERGLYKRETEAIKKIKIFYNNLTKVGN